jgi:hypothetical protein
VGLEGDQDGFGGGDTATVWGFFFQVELRERERDDGDVYLHARQSFRLTSAVWSFRVVPTLESLS